MIKNRSISRLNGEKGDNNVLISTRGRYAVRILADMAKYGSGGVVPLKEIAVRQDISLKYIERIMSSLKEANLVESRASAARSVKRSVYGANITK